MLSTKGDGIGSCPIDGSPRHRLVFELVALLEIAADRQDDLHGTHESLPWFCSVGGTRKFLGGEMFLLWWLRSQALCFIPRGILARSSNVHNLMKTRNGI